MNPRIYPEKLFKIVKDNKYIPRKMYTKERLKQYRKYWNEEYGVFKVKDVYFLNGIDHYSISYGSNMHGVIPYPLSNCYELLHNYDNLDKEPVINNRTKNFSGAEIRFWFAMNINDYENENYIGFKDIIGMNNTNLIDTHYYFVRRNKKNNIYEFIEKEKKK